MTSQTPPTYYFTNINFNSSFYTPITNQTYFDSRYLLKNYADSATSIETFKSGINSSIMNAVNSADNMTIGSNLSFGSMTLGSSNTASQLIINRPLLIGYPVNSYTASAQIGYNFNGSNSMSMLSGTTYNTSVFGLFSGVWLINYSLELTISTASITASDTFYGISNSTAISGKIQGCYNYLHINTMVYNVGDKPVFSSTGLYVNSTLSSYYMIAKITFTGTGTVTGNLVYNIVRIG